MKLVKLLLASACILTLHAGDLDDALEGFEDDGMDISVAQEDLVDTKAKPSWLRLSGAYTFSTAYNYISGAAIEGFSRARHKLDLDFDMTLSQNWKSKIELKSQYDPIYMWRGITNYTTTLEYLSEVKEAYVLGSFGTFDLKVGRQIVVWGKSDNIRITDVINPMDNREPGMVDIEDLRLAEVMSKLSYYVGDWSLNLLAIHESRIQYEAGIDSEFLPTLAFGASVPSPFPELVTPASNFEDTQYAFWADGRFNGWDLSFYWAHVLDQRWHMVVSPGPVITREYNKITMGGIAANVVLGSWLIKSEAAYFEGLIYNNIVNEKCRLDAMFGLEYTGLTDVVFSGEIANRHIFDYEASMINSPNYVREDEVTTALRVSYTFDHDNATISYLATLFGVTWQDGGFERLWMDYKVNDEVSLSLGLIDYIASDGVKKFFDAIADNDRIFFDVSYSF